MAGEQTAFKTALKKGATPIGNLVSVSGGGTEVEFVDTTHHGLTEAFRTFRATLASVPDITFKVQMTKANLTVLTALGDPLTDSFTDWTVEWPFPTTPVTMTMSCQLMKLEPGEATVDGLIEVDLTLKVSGKPTWGGLS